MNSQKFSIGTRIRQVLLSDGYINTYVNGQVFPIIAPQNTTGNFIVYSRDKYSKKYTNMGIYQEECILNITVVCDEYDVSQNIAIQINDILEGLDLGFEIKLTDSVEDFSDEKYIQTLIFSID